MTTESQVPDAGADGFLMHDELTGPDLDAARWFPTRPTLPSGSGELLGSDPAMAASRTFPCCLYPGVLYGGVAGEVGHGCRQGCGVSPE